MRCICIKHIFQHTFLSVFLCYFCSSRYFSYIGNSVNILCIGQNSVEKKLSIPVNIRLFMASFDSWNINITESFLPCIFHYKRLFLSRKATLCRDEKAVSTLNMSLCLFFMIKIFFLIYCPYFVTIYYSFCWRLRLDKVKTCKGFSQYKNSINKKKQINIQQINKKYQKRWKLFGAILMKRQE